LGFPRDIEGFLHGRFDGLDGGGIVIKILFEESLFALDRFLLRRDDFPPVQARCLWVSTPGRDERRLFVFDDPEFRGHEDEIIGTKKQTDEYAYQWATDQLVGNAAPLVLDARPVRKGENRKETIENLLDSAEELVYVDNVLGDRGVR